MLLAGAAGLGGGLAFTQHQPKVYESATSVLVQPVGAGQDSNVVGGRTRGELNLDTEAQLVRSTAVATDAAKLLRVTTPPDVLAAGASVDVPANTSVLVITYAAGSARDAQARSHAFAQAYLQNRQDSATADLTSQLATVNGKLQQLNAQLAQINAQLAGLAKSDSPTKANLDSQRNTVAGQINTLTGRANQLSTTTVSAGKIIRDADLPARPSKPDVPLNLASGAMAGLLLGVGAGLLRERLDRRVRRPADLPRRTGVGVLAVLPRRVRPRLDDVFAPFGAGGRIFNRLRNEVLASLPAAAGSSGGRVVVVTGASRGPVATLVAANLAAAFARTGSETVLVSAHLPDSVVDAAPAATLFGVRPVPGLSEVLAGRVDLAEAAQRAARDPWLRVITTGGTARAGGLLQAQALRDLLATLRAQAEYVVIEAPSTTASADAQTLAGLADGAVVAVEKRRTRYTDVADAAAQLSRVGTAVLGAVVLPRLSRLEAAPDEARPVPPELPAVINRPNGGPRPAPSSNGRNGQRPSADDTPTMIFSRIELSDLPIDPPTPAPAASPVGAPAAETGAEPAGGDGAAPAAASTVGTAAPAGSGGADDPGPAPRDATATGMIAALTEDGPLDATR